VAEAFEIAGLGRLGDGVARTEAGPVHIARALPGERVEAERTGEGRARLLQVLSPSPERVAPPCPHFGACGGCALQMLPLPATRAWKREVVGQALARAGIEAEVEPTVATPLAARRRAVLAARRAGKRVLLGLMERGGNRIADLGTCLVLVPAIADRFDALRALLGPLLAERPARVTVLAGPAGLDVAVTGGVRPHPHALARLGEAMQAAGAVRLSLDGEPLLTLAEPLLEVAGVPLAPPPGGFAQASAEAEDAMAGLVAGHLAGSARIADLFCGFGTFALRLARFSPVTAIDADAPALAALALAQRRAPGLKPIETRRRNLLREPLTPEELAPFDGIVFDPPEAGARAQAEAIAASRIARVAGVSCNPASFARDAAILVAGGYRLERAVPVDQFAYSAAVEVVGLFARG